MPILESVEGRDGATAAGILRAAVGYGLEADAYHAEVEELAGLPMPLILHWEFRHFLVLERITGRKVVLMDPAQGRRSLDHGRFRESYTGVAMTFSPGPAFRPRRKRLPSRDRYFAMIREHLPSLGLVLLGSLWLQALGLVLPLGQKVLVDQVLLPRREGWLWGLAAALAGAASAQALLSYSRIRVLQNLQATTNLALARSFMGHLLALPIAFFLQRGNGDLVHRLDSQGEVQNLFTERSVAALLDAFLLAGYATLMVAFHARLGALVILLSLTQVACRWAIRERKARLMAAELAAAGNASSVLVESLSTLETIQVAGAGRVFVQRWADARIPSLNAALERQGLEANLGAVDACLGHLGATLVLLAAGWEVLNHSMTLGTFSAFLTLQTLLLVPLSALLEAWGQLQGLGSHLARLDDVMEARPEPGGDRDPGKLTGAIDLAGVSYHFPGCPEPALAGVDLQVKAGSMVALAGPTGAGKSTLARLLLGMHVPDEGSIRFDGLDLRTLDLPHLRRNLGVVHQDTFLLNDTVWANLALQAPDLPRERLIEAARSARVHEVLSALPQGYDTVIGENGLTLSGGQRQRLALARALAPRPAILLLDEATSALDPETEAAVHRNLAGLGCTRIVIAHRLATLADADLILVLERGRVVQRGRYRELAECPGLFRTMVECERGPNP
ncbi:peptidase domain-containing ABC transporter [Mesoterricola sediminis]|uniref:NHLP family bacteriocin export ABC transporter peptidase/permease/ATPase n=1 Tax=Mesoterricola sediminis TaxID=2927980 RepID=A0AA48H0L7_9BACT|nr:ATP-binding cassette domain-containing protein [Mesoterricola sediminis]BDU77447.1 NHLP family bacteriocin export ABC transporter peptidase/permease/ATPase [Mesoterricola sediminis]